MIKLQWVTTEGSNDPPKLQFQLAIAVDASGGFCPGTPGEWQDVPTVVLPAEPDESELLREAREIVAAECRRDGNEITASAATEGHYNKAGLIDQAVRAVMAALRRGR